MPKKLTSEEIQVVLNAVGRFPEGASVDEVSYLLNRAVPRRTLQRRLALLVSQHLVFLEGDGRSSRYRLNLTLAEAPPEVPRATLSAAQLQLSEAGAEVRRLIRDRAQPRETVGYNREFLERYRPNETAYLPLPLRQYLAGIGKAPVRELPAGTYARQMLNRLLIDLSWNSSRLEGNTYSLLETERLLSIGKGATGKTAREAQMILNHKTAIELLVDQADGIGFNRYTILNLHAALAEDLLDNEMSAGRLRTIPVSIGGSVFRPLQNPALIEECFDRILAVAEAIEDPFERSFFVMVHFPYLQPFEDVNKRVSRLAANIPLIQKNLSPLSFIDVPARDYVDGILGVYELNRIELLRDVFVWAYERSSARYAVVQRSLGDPNPFRQRHRTAVVSTVGEIIRTGMDRSSAVAFIRRMAETEAPSEDRARLVELVESEILSLHEGNFARYRVRPSEYEAWRAGWQ